MWPPLLQLPAQRCLCLSPDRFAFLPFTRFPNVRSVTCDLPLTPFDILRIQVLWSASGNPTPAEQLPLCNSARHCGYVPMVAHAESMEARQHHPRPAESEWRARCEIQHRASTPAHEWHSQKKPRARRGFCVSRWRGDYFVVSPLASTSTRRFGCRHAISSVGSSGRIARRAVFRPCRSSRSWPCPRPC